MSPACDIDTDIANARCPVRCVASGAQRAEANGHLSWPGSVPAIHVLLAERCSRRGCPRQAGMTNVNRAASASMFSISWQTREFLFPCPGRDAARSDASLIRGATPVQAIAGLKLRAGAHGGQPRLVLSAPAPRISAAPLRAASHPGHSVRKPTAICHGRAPSRPFTSCLQNDAQDVDARDKRGHDGCECGCVVAQCVSGVRIESVARSDAADAMQRAMIHGGGAHRPS